jgi:hypothetical protein
MPRRVLPLALLTLLAAVNGAEAGRSGLVIDVDGPQLVTMNGSASSLAELVSDLCTLSGVSLRGYEAADRPITVAYQAVPLHEVLLRMLRDENYIIGVRAGAGVNNFEVSWLHVTGAKAGSARPGAIPVPTPIASSAATPAGQDVPGGMAGFGAEPAVVTKALGSANAVERKAAARELADHLEANPSKIDAFLARPIDANVAELSTFPYAGDALQSIWLRQKDPAVRAKLEAIVLELDKHRGGPRTPPSFLENLEGAGSR